MRDNNEGAGRKLWNLTNEIVKSPLFVFLVGGSFLALWPQFEEWRLPEAQRQARQLEQQARADAALIAPFLANLNASEPGRYRASAAALSALELASKNAHGGKTSPMFAGVNGAIDEVARQLFPQPPTVTPEVIKSLDAQAKPAAPSVSGSIIGALTNALVYIQVDKNDATKVAKATAFREELRRKSVLAPGIQTMPSNTIPNKTQVRYFDDEDKDAAAQVAALLAQSTGLQVFTAKPALKANRGTVEVWFGRD
jgi:hypothetical protein